MTVGNSILSRANWTRSSSVLSHVLINAEARKALSATETEREQEESDPWKTQISEFVDRRKRNAIFNTDISTILARAVSHNPCFPCKLVKREKPLESEPRGVKAFPLEWGMTAGLGKSFISLS